MIYTPNYTRQLRRLVVWFGWGLIFWKAILTSRGKISLGPEFEDGETPPAPPVRFLRRRKSNVEDPGVAESEAQYRRRINRRNTRIAICFWIVVAVGFVWAVPRLYKPGWIELSYIEGEAVYYERHWFGPTIETRLFYRYDPVEKRWDWLREDEMDGTLSFSDGVLYSREDELAKRGGCWMRGCELLQNGRRR